MQLEPQITFRNLDKSPAVEARILERIGELGRFHERITGCRVTVEAEYRRQHKGHLYHVSVDLTVPGGEIVVSRNSAKNAAHEDIYVAVRDAFDAARRRLADHARRIRGDVKSHDGGADHGRVARLFPEQGYGFIATPEGEEIYMHRNSVLGDAFDKLSIGDEVRYALHPKEGEKGPQASTVTPVGKHHTLP